MATKVILNALVNPSVRLYIKIKAAKEGMTMQALVEKIILEWKDAQTNLE